MSKKNDVKDVVEVKKQRMKILFYCDSASAHTGFGVVAKNLIKYLLKTGKYEIFQLGINYWGDPVEEQKWEHFHLYPMQNDPYGRNRLFPLLVDIQPEILFTLNDYDACAHIPEALSLYKERTGKKCRWELVSPIDGEPIYPEWVEFIKKHTDKFVVVSKYAQSVIAKTDATFVPDQVYHGFDDKVFYPLEDSKIEGYRKQLQKKFIVLCFKPNEKVLMSDYSYKNISDIKVNDEVFTHLANKEKVTEIFERDYDGNIVSLGIYGYYKKLEATPEHPILTIDRENILCKMPSRINRNYICRPTSVADKYCTVCIPDKFEGADFKAIKDVKVGDFVLVPINYDYKNIDKIDICDFVLTDEVNYEVTDNNILHQKYSNYKIKRYIELSELSLKVFGYYLAEGNFTKKNSSGAYITQNNDRGITGLQFTFNIDEDEYVKDVCDFAAEIGAPYSVYKYPESGSQVVKINNTILGYLFKKLFKEYANGKDIHSIFMQLRPDKQLVLFEGWKRGDGHQRKYETTIVSCSFNLIHKMRHILLRNNIDCSIMVDERSKRRSNEQDIYCLRIKDSHFRDYGRFNERKIIHDGYMWLEVTTKDNYNYNGKVYNFEVENDHSYLVNDIAVHNCVGVNQLRKGYPIALQAFATFAKDKDDVLLFLHTQRNFHAGWNLDKLIRLFGITDKVVFTDNLKGPRGVADSELNLIYNICNVFLTTTVGEGFGLPILEAMAVGKPVVYHNVTSVPEIIGDAGIPIKTNHFTIFPNNDRELVRPIADVQEIVNALEELYQKPELAKELGQKAYMRAIQMKNQGLFNWDVIGDYFDKSFEDLMKETEDCEEIRLDEIL